MRAVGLGRALAHAARGALAAQDRSIGEFNYSGGRCHE